MDFRQYDNAIGRFNSIDALAEMQYSHTPYHFGYNNPSYWADPTGLISDDVIAGMWNATADGTNSYWYNSGTGMTSDNLGGGSGGNVDFATGGFTGFDSLGEVTIKTNSRGDSSFIGQLTSHVYSNGKYYEQFRADNLTRATDDVQEYFGMLGAIDPIGIIDGLNAVGYGFRGQKANAIASGLAILPFGDLAKLVKIQKHHIIPQAVFRDAGEAIQNAMELNGGFNLKKLPTPFHGNHPQYNTFVRNQLNAINKVNVTPGSIQTLQKDLNGMINNAYDNYKATGQNLNDYFRQFNGN